ncbi:hypothetical protein ACBY01_07660 [Sphingomonas sp. ac-8]|uniref:hypothetical protein n=1 Tax=Sphingomonas sp. ac-8 TaxID=3242977 RepID=UPI003A808393
MPRFVTGLLAIATAAASSTMPAAAQQVQTVKAAAGKPYPLKHSKLRFPATLAGAPRIKVQTIGDDLLDVFATYESPDRKQLISVYVTRQVAGAVPVWFDRARWSIEHRPDVYGTPVRAVGAPSFVPPRQQTPSGLIATYTLNKPPYRSTGVAILPFGAWLVKLRYSSETLEAASLATAMRETLAELDWPRSIPAAPAATPVAECTTPLALSGDAKPAPADGAAVLLGAMLANMAAAPAKKSKAKQVSPPPVWCRDTTVLPAGGVYRPDGSTDRYLIALSDAGRGIFVAPDAAAALLADDSAATPSWSVTLEDMATSSQFAPQDRLPPPTQVLDEIVRADPVSSVTTWGGKQQIHIDSDALGSGDPAEPKS